ncbi:MAG: hypothetical protein M3O23_05285 [Actinomycetota bacterium]|nr:hypothetical protein [Actinomycetota bacterium]
MRRAQRAAHPSSVWLVIAAVFSVNAWVAAAYGQRLFAGLAVVTALSSLWAARPAAHERRPPDSP